MTTDFSPLPETPLAWSGIHHIALATQELDATVAFYRDILGVQVSDIYPSREGRGRHAIMLVDPTNPNSLGLHFFERPNLTTTGSPLLHFALRLSDSVFADQLRKRLHNHAIDVREIPELHSFLFADTNGLLIEVIVPQEQVISRPSEFS